MLGGGVLFSAKVIYHFIRNLEWGKCYVQIYIVWMRSVTSLTRPLSIPLFEL